MGGYPIPGLGRGYPIPGLDGVPPWTWDRVPPPDLGQGTPLQTWDGVPPSWTWDRVPPRTWDGIPPLDLGWGTPQPGTGYLPLTRSGLDRAAQRTASTWYAAGGVPLAFTQEDFLVVFFFLICCRLFSVYRQRE